MPNFYDVCDDSTFPVIAAKAYRNNCCVDIIEFEDDLNRIRSIKKLLNKYRNGQELKVLLIMNHLTVFYNVFGPEECATKMLVFKLGPYLEYLKPFFMYMGRWPEKVEGLGPRRDTFFGDEIPTDERIVRLIKETLK